MEKYYFTNSLEEYDDIKNGIICISGKLFNFLYQNKERKGAKILLEKITQKCKIYFNMLSIDKNMLVDYFRNDPKNIVCVIGQCDTDIDSILSSDIGINLKTPNNINTILSHFYSSKKDIKCIEEIIETGKLLYDNIYMLEYISFTYPIIINSYLLTCMSLGDEIETKKLDFLEIEFFIFLIFSFFGKSNKNNIHIDQKSKLLRIYNIIIFLINFFFKLFGPIIVAHTFIPTDISKAKQWRSYYFTIESEYIICLIFSFNFASFYKKSPFENIFLVIITLLYLMYTFTLVFLCSSNFSNDILNITNFNNIENFVDHYTDLNKVYIFFIILFDLLATFIFILVIKIIFRKCLI